MKLRVSLAVGVAFLLLCGAGSCCDGDDDSASPTPSCPADPKIVINEILPNPAGADEGKEVLEVYNPDSIAISISGWSLAQFKSDPDSPLTVTLSGKISVPAGGYLVIGEENAGVSIDVVVDLDLGNGTNGDGIHLIDGCGNVVDAVIYGNNNDDGILDESGKPATSWAPNPGEDQVLARCPDGRDTDACGDDFRSLDPRTATLGGSNGDCEPPLPTPCALESANLKINEVAANPEGSDADGQEYIEIGNPESHEVTLGGWRIVYFKSDPEKPSGEIDLPDDVTIPAGGFLVLGDEGTDAPVDLVAPIDLGNGTHGDGIHLMDPCGVVVDALVYGDDNDDGILDESGQPATSLAPKPGDGEVLARCGGFTDTDRSGDDFFLVPTGEATPGQPNPECVPVTSTPILTPAPTVPPPAPTPTASPTCSLASDVSVVVNEFLYDAPGSDTGFEWVEIYNDGTAEADLSGWVIRWAKSSTTGGTARLPAGTTLAPSGILLVGEESVEPTPGVTLDLDLGNGTNGDALYLDDCTGTLEDAVVYGGSNEDGHPDQYENPATSIAPAVDAGESLERYPDGADTGRSGDDFCRAQTPTPGSANEVCAGESRSQ